VFPIAATVRSLRPPVITLTLIVVNVLVFLYEVSLPEGALESLLLRGGVIPAREMQVLREAPGALHLWFWPILTSMFLHGGWMHLVGNMLFLNVFGNGVENRLGHGRFLAFYLLCGAAASQAQVLMQPGSTVPMIGASGAISGVLGAFLVLYPLSRIVVLVPVIFLPFFFEIPALIFLGFWFLQQLVAGTLWTLNAEAAQGGGVAWWAHAGGFLAGIVLLGIFLDRKHLGHEPRHYTDPRYYWQPY